MGEMADMVLDGDVCQSCGEYIGEGMGFPRSCAGCAPPKRHRERPDQEPDRPFFLRKREHLRALEKWLKDRTFNVGGYIKDDKNGNPMVSIGYDAHPDNDWKFPDKRGLIVVIDRQLLPDVEAMVQRLKKTGE